ncbi:hypothetical protein [Pontibacter rugosus]|uniref:Uncharacterized protein n=1 Tax=Pontibacter rugosus TaxID=1745966 RepID=A0ABW3SQZ8_9BACT
MIRQQHEAWALFLYVASGQYGSALLFNQTEIKQFPPQFDVPEYVCHNSMRELAMKVAALHPILPSHKNEI